MVSSDSLIPTNTAQLLCHELQRHLLQLLGVCHVVLVLDDSSKPDARRGYLGDRAVRPIANEENRDVVGLV